MQINVVNQDPKFAKTIPIIKLRRMGLKCIELLGEQRLRNRSALDRTELTIVLLSPLAMKKINFAFRKKNKPTDVLSFPTDRSDSLGELLLCPTVLAKQAKLHHVSFESETALMMIHGLLHLLGYDHEVSEKDARIMDHLQRKLLQKMGYLPSRVQSWLNHIPDIK